MTRDRTAFWAVAFAFLVVMAFATLPSPLYGLYRERDGLSALTITIVYAIFAASTIAALVAVPFVAARVGRRAVMFAAVATMMAAAAEASRHWPPEAVHCEYFTGPQAVPPMMPE